MEGFDHPALQIDRPARRKTRPRHLHADRPVLPAADPGRPGRQVGFELHGIKMAPAPFRSLIMHRAILLTIRTGRAGAQSVDELQIDPLTGDTLHQGGDGPWLLKAGETLIVWGCCQQPPRVGSPDQSSRPSQLSEPPLPRPQREPARANLPQRHRPPIHPLIFRYAKRHLDQNRPCPASWRRNCEVLCPI